MADMATVEVSAEPEELEVLVVIIAELEELEELEEVVASVAIAGPVAVPPRLRPVVVV